MALLNYIGPGTYTVVNQFDYQKAAKYIRFTIDVYQDSTKEVKLASTFYEVYGRDPIWGVKSLGQKTIPTSPEDGDGYVVSSGAEGEWATRSGQLARWSAAKNEWEYWYFAEGQFVYLESTARYYVFRDGVFSPGTCLTDDRLWEAYFKPELAITSSNVLAQLYTFLKTLPGFQACQDG